MDNRLGESIREQRERLGFNQREFAEQIGMSVAYLSQIETGAKKWPRKYIPAIAKALGVSVEDLSVVAGRIRFRTIPATVAISVPPANRADAFWHSLTVDQKDKFLAWVEEADARAQLKDERERDEPAASG